MEQSKIIFKNSKEFIKGKQKNLLLLFFVPVLITIVYELFNSWLEFLKATNNPMFIQALFVVIVIFIFRVIVDTATPFAIINYIDTAHTGSILTPINSYKFGWKRLFFGFIMQLIRACIVMIGLIALIVPGIYFLLMFIFADYVYIIRKKSFKDSLMYSFHIMQSNIRQFIRKFGYIFLRGLVWGLPFVLSLMIVIFSFSMMINLGNILFVLAIILGLGGVIFFGIKTIQISLISQEYLYQVFLAIEQTKGEITEDALLVSKQKCKKWLVISTAIAIAFLILFFVLIL